MSEFEDIQRLIRLKRYENPGEDFTEDFLHKFHQRQRAELLKKSSLALMWERTLTWWENLTAAPRWAFATATAAFACLVGVSVFKGGGQQPAVVELNSPVPAEVVPEKPFIPKMDLSELPMANIAERNNAKLEESLLRKHLEVRPALEGSVQPLPASAKGEQTPTPQKAGQKDKEP